jgi:hypothetical protein
MPRRTTLGAEVIALALLAFAACQPADPSNEPDASRGEDAASTKSDGSRAEEVAPRGPDCGGVLPADPQGGPPAYAICHTAPIEDARPPGRDCGAILPPPDDRVSYACGSGCRAKTCVTGTTFCRRITFGNSSDSPECLPLPDACAGKPTCACACPDIRYGNCGPGTTGCSCTERDGRVTVSCSGA